ncbi:unnamed protein product, partial [Callosobruchus maculatus]
PGTILQRPQYQRTVPTIIPHNHPSFISNSFTTHQQAVARAVVLRRRTITSIIVPSVHSYHELHTHQRVDACHRRPGDSATHPSQNAERAPGPGEVQAEPTNHQDIPRVHQDPSKYPPGATRNYPDLIERSPSSAHFRTYRGYGGGSRAASETSGSVQDINEIFCTLPRKKDLIRGSRYNSSDSQTPLLPDSRYA